MKYVTLYGFSRCPTTGKPKPIKLYQLSIYIISLRKSIASVFFTFFYLVLTRRPRIYPDDPGSTQTTQDLPRRPRDLPRRPRIYPDDPGSTQTTQDLPRRPRDFPGAALHMIDPLSYLLYISK